MSEASTPARPLAAPGPRPQTMTFQNVVNRVMRGLLRTPLVSRLIGGRLVTLSVVGRKSGRRYTVVVAYTRHQDGLLIGSPFGWGRNLRTGEPLEIRRKGRRRLADVRAMTGEQEVTAAYAVICRDNRAFAKFNKIGLDAAGEPDQADLRSAWAAGARAFQLTPR